MGVGLTKSAWGLLTQLFFILQREIWGNKVRYSTWPRTFKDLCWRPVPTIDLFFWSVLIQYVGLERRECTRLLKSAAAKLNRSFLSGSRTIHHSHGQNGAKTNETETLQIISWQDMGVIWHRISGWVHSREQVVYTCCGEPQMLTFHVSTPLSGCQVKSTVLLLRLILETVLQGLKVRDNPVQSNPKEEND